MALKLFSYVRSALFILVALLIGNLIQSVFHLGIPGSIIGMLLLFFLMASGIVKAEWVKPTAQLFVRYMIVLFIPTSVGLMEHFELLTSNALPILASTVGGTAIVLVTLSLMLQKMLEKKK